MTRFIPKEKLTAYQRWELAAFDEENAALKEKMTAAAELPEEQPQAEQVPPSEPSPPPAPLPTAADIERIHSEARERGHSAGYNEGLAEAQAITAQMEALLSSLQQALKDIDQHIADQLLATSIEVANQVLRQSLQIKPELLLPVVREAIATLQPGSEPSTLFVHPLDAALVRTHMGEQLANNNYRIIEDSTLTQGGCRVELGASAIDATLETRWKRVIESMGITQDWLDDNR